MAGSAVLGPNLVDGLIPGVIDGIRGALFPTLGVRQFRAFVVTRTYDGEIGTTPYTDAEIELTPQPLVLPYEDLGDLHYEKEPCGIDEAGFVYVKEVSLTYTESELAGPPADPMRQELFVRIQDAHGQGIKTRYFRHYRPPFPDREKDMGWALQLLPVAKPEGL